MGMLSITYNITWIVCAFLSHCSFFRLSSCMYSIYFLNERYTRHAVYAHIPYTHTNHTIHHESNGWKIRRKIWPKIYWPRRFSSLLTGCKYIKCKAMPIERISCRIEYAAEWCVCVCTIVQHTQRGFNSMGYWTLHVAYRMEQMIPFQQENERIVINGDFYNRMAEKNREAISSDWFCRAFLMGKSYFWDELATPNEWVGWLWFEWWDSCEPPASWISKRGKVLS